VRFTTGPDAALAGAKFYITSAPFQNPLGVCVLDTNGPGGAPGDTILGYSERLVDVWPGFIEVEFPKPLMVPNDGAYIVYLQTRGGNGDSDCIGVDKSSPPESRSWIHESGLWTRMTPSQGNVMIRAIVTTETPIVKRSWGVLRAIHR
jgi:hypothetical protein